MPEVLIFYTTRAHPFAQPWVWRIVQATLAQTKAYGGDLSITFMGDSRMRYLNRTYRRKNSTTDVLSFSGREEISLTNHIFDPAALPLGDICISLPQAKRQAHQKRRAYEEEVAELIIHGILHLLGFDHVEKKEAAQMFSFQYSILERIKKI